MARSPRTVKVPLSTASAEEQGKLTNDVVEEFSHVGTKAGVVGILFGTALEAFREAVPHTERPKTQLSKPSTFDTAEYYAFVVNWTNATGKALGFSHAARGRLWLLVGRYLQDEYERAKGGDRFRKADLPSKGGIRGKSPEGKEERGLPGLGGVTKGDSDTATARLRAVAGDYGLSPQVAKRVLEAAALKVVHETVAQVKVKSRPKWENRNGADAKLTPPEFIAKHYADEMAAGTLHRGVIAQEDKPLAVKLASWLRSHLMPDGVDIPTKPEWVTRQIEAGKAKQAAAPRPRTEEQRIYDALQNRRRRARQARSPVVKKTGPSS